MAIGLNANNNNFYNLDISNLFMKKVLYLYYDLPAYRRDFLTSLSNKLNKENIDFKFIYGKQSNSAVSIQDKNVSFKTIELELKKIHVVFAELLIYKDLIKIIKQEKPDVVVLQFHVAVLSFWRLYFYLMRLNIPYITWDCNYTRDTLNGLAVKIRKKMVDFTYKNAKVCLTYGHVFKDYLLNMGKPEDCIVVAQNTINVEKIFENRSKACEKRSFNSPLRILYVGALIQRKYVESAIKAVGKLIIKGYDIYFDIVGTGDYIQSLKKLNEVEGSTDRIIFHGAKKGKELQRFFEEDDVFILPGTGGLAINEAMAYSMPIISTKGDDTVLDLLDGNGYLLKDFGNVDEIYTCLKDFIELPEIEKQKMAKRSEEIIIERASLENMVNKHVLAIKKTLK